MGFFPKRRIVYESDGILGHWQRWEDHLSWFQTDFGWRNDPNGESVFQIGALESEEDYHYLSIQ